MNRLPIGIQSFEKIRKDYIYVDKTEYIHELVNSGAYIFLSRPRRFGKSLLVDTLRCLFEGREKLFKGLWIHDRWDWDKRYPVIKIDMGSFYNKDLNIFDNELRTYLTACLKKKPDKEEFSPKHYMIELVRFMESSFDQKPVILIDEYDKPILDNIEKKEYAVEIRDYLRSFYEVFKALDEHIKFFLMTGVSKFSRVSLFSGLNNLEDISVYPEFGTILGYTEKEIFRQFHDYLAGVEPGKLAYWYNGYNFLGTERVYNPFDILQFLKTKRYQNYWFRTGTPSFLIKIMNERGEEPDLARIENSELSAGLLDSFDVYTMPIETLLFQSGYLTVKEEIESPRGISYRLEIPNYEVRQSLNREFLFNYLKSVSSRDEEEYANRAWLALEKKDVDGFLNVIKSLFAGIPYSSVDLSRYEDYYKSVLYAFLLGAGLEVICEDITARGRMDISVRLPEIYHRNSAVIVMELKVVNREEGRVLRQIKEKGYHKKYMDRTCFIAGLEFDKEKKELYTQWEKVDSKAE